MFQLPPLPYDKSSLEPHMSAKTFEFHHEKHHAAYINKTNELIAGTEFESPQTTLEQILKASFQKNIPLFNNAAQAWNHQFFFESLAKDQPLKEGKLLSAIVEKFGSLEKFKADFAALGVAQFGSGWVWLVKDEEGNLELLKTANAENPLIQGKTPLLTCDVWEHAYYLDYQNRRPDFLKTFIEHLVNWEWVEKRLG